MVSQYFYFGNLYQCLIIFMDKKHHILFFFDAYGNFKKLKKISFDKHHILDYT